MEKRYVGTHVNLHFLVKNLTGFFKNLGFETTEERSDKGCKIVVIPSHEHDVRDRVRIYMVGNPDNFSIKFVAGARSRSLVKWGRLTTLFGGGAFLLKGLKSKEALEKLEKKFWVYVNEKIDHLTNSAEAF